MYRIYSGLGMRLCIDLGLHRHQSHLRPSLQSELEKRLFWSCYYLDREVSIALGRPMAISDHDIDVKVRHVASVSRFSLTCYSFLLILMKT